MLFVWFLNICLLWLGMSSIRNFLVCGFGLLMISVVFVLCDCCGVGRRKRWLCIGDYRMLICLWGNKNVARFFMVSSVRLCYYVVIWEICGDCIRFTCCGFGWKFVWCICGVLEKSWFLILDLLMRKEIRVYALWGFVPASPIIDLMLA